MDDRVFAVQKMQDYIESHFMEEITLAQLSKVAMYSPWYSYRIFKEYTGLSIADYIRKFRLSKSALKLRDGKIKIIEVAIEMGFKSTDGYQRAFYKEFHCNPNAYAKNPSPIYLFNPYGVQFKNKEKSVNKYTRNTQMI